MSTPPSRPAHLPDFQQPPLNEVVVGVQFAPARGYRQINAGEVWALYKANFPIVEEQPPLHPVFEVFGMQQTSTINFGMISGPLHDRFWFISPKKDELIQFQQDRLLHNWRKVGDEGNDYPRFEKMIGSFTEELLSLETYFRTLAPQDIDCNQAEITYINHIPLMHEDVRTSIDDWLRFLRFGDNQPDDASGVLRRVLKSSTNQPIGRLSCEIASFIKPPHGPTISLSLTVRGAPGSTVASAIEFLKHGREVIVEEFAAITTDSAHKIWGRVR